MTESSPSSPDLTEEEVLADEAARLRDPARWAILHRASGSATQRLAERLSPPAAPVDAVDGAQ